MAELKFIFQQNADVPRGKVAVRPLGEAGQWHVMASEELTDAQIVMAISRFIAKHDPESGENTGDTRL
jgi:hypothetical protein